MIMAACTISHYHVADAFVAEALAYFQAIVFAKDLGFRRIIVEESVAFCFARCEANNVVYVLACDGRSDRAPRY
ncbi:hypothetical protein V6N12_058563 [Hibiscus sabdariffa]|uniref:RNase H type-1 domain-containing protein n=1 Tax=Hibiscus sabdariffa TaxID=183260 RepID=A0ABR2ESH7_9ROSI